MLKGLECTEGEFVQVLGVPVEHLFDEEHAPDWVNDIIVSERVSGDEWPSWLPESEGARLLSPFVPLMNSYFGKLSEYLGEKEHELSRKRLSIAAWIEPLRALLFNRVFFVSQRATALEVNVQSILGNLSGETPEERFRHFVATMRESKTRLEFLQKYPVLARNLQKICSLWLQTATEFINHLLTDIDALRVTFGIDANDDLDSVRPGGSDLHNGGRSVITLSFKSGRKLVYKPRSIGIELHFQELISWLNAQGLEPPLRTLEVLDCGTHGWVEFVEHIKCGEKKGIDAFYRRQGSLLAIMHALCATDMHYENIIASGADPIAVDLETLFHSTFSGQDFRTANEACAQRIRESVMAVGLLPEPSIEGENQSDLSGLGAKAGQASGFEVLSIENMGTDRMQVGYVADQVVEVRNRPEDSERVPVSLLLEGFGDCYGLLMKNKEALLEIGGPLSAFESARARIVVRPTWVYSMYIMDCTHPDFLGDELDRCRYLSGLWDGVKDWPILKKFVPSELKQLTQGDIPYFFISSGETEAVGGDGSVIEDAVSKPGLSLAKARIASFSEQELAKQCWFIRASFGHVDGYFRRPSSPDCFASADTLLVVATEIGREIVGDLTFSGEMASCLNVTSVEGSHGAHDLRYSVEVAENGMYEGLGGICFFLAYLAEATGLAEFRQASEAILSNILKCEELRKSDQISGLSGLGGLVYLYTHLGQLWNRGDLLDRAELLVKDIGPLLQEDRTFDLISGAGGCLLSLLPLIKIRAKSDALKIARLCGDHLLDYREGERRSWHMTPMRRGFSHGASGISFALARLYRVTGDDERYRLGAVEALEYERPLLAGGNWTDDHGQTGSHQCSWCHGAPGIAIARLGLYEAHGDGSLLHDYTEAIEETAKSFWTASQCLCHGSLGSLDPIIEDSRREIPVRDWRTMLAENALRVIEDMLQNGWRSALPSQTLGNGLFTGLSGIGYGLLRLRNPEKIPSILRFEGPVA